jgi:hypothetical protein
VVMAGLCLGVSFGFGVVVDGRILGRCRPGRRLLHVRFQSVKQFENLTTVLRVPGTSLKDSVPVSTRPLLMAPNRR